MPAALRIRRYGIGPLGDVLYGAVDQIELVASLHVPHTVGRARGRYVIGPNLYGAVDQIELVASLSGMCRTPLAELEGAM